MTLFVPKEEQERRMKICEKCPELWKDGLKNIRCKKCGCFLEAKTRFVGQHCPINKW